MVNQFKLKTRRDTYGDYYLSIMDEEGEIYNIPISHSRKEELDRFINKGGNSINNFNVNTETEELRK